MMSDTKEVQDACSDILNSDDDELSMNIEQVEM